MLSGLGMRRGLALSLSTSVLALLASGAAQSEPSTRPEPAAVAALDQPAEPNAAKPAAAPVEAPPAAPAKPVEAATPAAEPAPAQAAAPPPAPAPVQAAAAPVPAPADPVVAAIRERGKRPVSGLDKAGLDAVTAFYANRTEPLFVTAGAWNARAEAVVAELARADDWGLVASTFAVAKPASADPTAQADAEVALVAATLRYARQASGGRIDPASLSRYNDLRGTFADPDDVLAGIASSAKPEAVLLSVHPKHPQYQKLHEALVKLRRGPVVQDAAAPTPVLEPVAATGPTLKPGAAHPDVAAIRARLNVTASAGAEQTYDDALVAAVKGFQAEKGLKSTGIINNATRAAFTSAEAKRPKAADPAKDAERIVLNMERWRWMPRDLGAFHIINNVPEFATRVFKNGQIIHQERIIVGKTNTQTPQFSANMQFVIFQPEWGVPDSIKVKEIWPSLRRKASGDLFDFGGGSDTRILQRHNMRVAYNGQVVDASKIDWSTTDPRQYSFIQAAGGGNVLGVVKFRFPNRHDVYMHDTPERSLFQNPVRAYSHGCVRVNNPRRLAEVILAEAETPSWTPERVGAAIANKATQDIKLDKPFPVHVAYHTARVDETTGKLQTFADLYGQDARLQAALSGKPVALEPQETKEELSAEIRKQQSKKQSQAKNDSGEIGNFFSGLFGN